MRRRKPSSWRAKQNQKFQNKERYIRVHKTVLVTPPDTEPITLEEANRHLQVSGQDDYVGPLITVARQSLENYLRRSLITQEWEVYYDHWEKCGLKIPYPKIQSVESVKYFNLNAVETTLTPETDYWTELKETPGVIKYAYDFCPPELQLGRPSAIKISYTAGYGDEATDVPETLRHGIKLILTNYFEHRGDVVIGPAGVNLIPDHIKKLVHNYRIYEF